MPGATPEGEEQAFLPAGSGLRWSADPFSSCHSSSGFPQGQGWAVESPAAFLGLDGAVLPPAGAGDTSSRGTSCPREPGTTAVPVSRREGGHEHHSGAGAVTHGCSLAAPGRGQRLVFRVSAPTSASLGPAAARQQMPDLHDSAEPLLLLPLRWDPSPPSSRTFSSPQHGEGGFLSPLDHS